MYKTPATPTSVAVVGAGFFGSGLLRRLVLTEGFAPRVVANRTLERALEAFGRAGIESSGVVIARDVGEAQLALSQGAYVATTDLLLPSALAEIDVIAETTGDLLVGTQVAQSAIAAGKHLVAANSDVQATVGPILQVMAENAGVVYTDIEGDEPGLLTQLIEYCQDLGLEVIVAANGKGVVKRYATPSTQAGFAAENGIQAWLATAAADGTKLNFELTVVANATGLIPAVPGMYGPVSGPGRLIDDFARLGLLQGGPYVDYVLGERGVFVIIRSEDPQVRADFRYLKFGDGPYYVFHRPEVLAHYAAPLSIARAARLRQTTVSPRGAPVADTIAFGKRDLPSGHSLDGIGGFDTYGLIMRSEVARDADLLPIGLAQYARLRRAVRKDEPMRYSDVEIEVDNEALALRRQQDALFAQTMRGAGP